MKLKSRGLGRKELVMDFREYTVAREGNEIVITGTIREPVHWDFSIRMCEDDLAGVTRVALQRPTIGLILRAMFKRNKDAHWSVDRKEHLEQARVAREELLEREAAKAAGEADPSKRARGAARNGSTSEAEDAGDDETAGLSRREQRKQHRLARRGAKAASATDDEAASVEMSSAHRHDEPADEKTADDTDAVDAHSVDADSTT